MPDLSAYINFTVRLDYIQDKIVLTDTSNYPVGVAAGITGKFDITHPDKITQKGSWAGPDVTWNGSSLTVSLRELRKNEINNPQCGAYTIVYTVDHPDYSPTELTRTFTLDYKKVTPSVRKDFDVFTPNLSLTDTTVYGVTGFTISSQIRAWSVNVGTTLFDPREGSAATLSLAVNGNYYDAVYTGGFDTNVIYQSTTYAYLTVRDNISYTLSGVSANTPPDTCELLSNLNTLKSRMDAAKSNCSEYDALKKTFEYGANLYFLILQNLMAGTTNNVISYVDEFLTLYYNAVPGYTNTNAVIPAYTFCYSMGGGDSLTKLFFEYSGTASASYSNAQFSGKTILLFMREGQVIKDSDFSLTGTTVSFTNGDNFLPGLWYTFILKS